VRASSAASRGPQSRVLRIIAGHWRGRRWRFPAQVAIRPTPDRVRETLFNWLGPRVRGMRCLDPFAGSGALGLEALSRGAAQVVFIERDPTAARELARLLTEWGAVGASVTCADARSYLEGSPEPFDLVFLDPPFDSGLLAGIAERLERGGWLAPEALIYAECAAREGLPALPPNWQPVKAKRAGEVGYHLLERSPAAAPKPR